MHSLRKIVLPLESMAGVRAEAREQGYDFIETTVNEWATGVNRFDGAGEFLCGVFDGDALIAMGGLTADPFVQGTGIGRIRRVYVTSSWRNQGVGTLLVNFLVKKARGQFRGVRLRAENSEAARLYERLGFVSIAEPHATHVLWLE